jgi:serine/threonine protein kinase
VNTIEDYLITGDLVSTGFFTLYTVKHKSNGEVFLLKTFHRLDAYRIASLRSGMQLIKELQLDIILEPVEFFEQGLQASILYKHFESISLRSLLREKKALPPEHFLATAKKLASLLSVIHSRGWILKNLCPENILINYETQMCKLADLRKATRIHKKEKTDLYEKADLLELQYISPEQTGRISQLTDNRSDLYSLGVIFYEMLTGQLPFQSADPVEIIHALLASPIIEPVLVNPSIPRVLNEIVTKLIAKSPEERYQSCEGLLYDLELAQDYLSSTDIFKLARKDKIKRLCLRQS